MSGCRRLLVSVVTAGLLGAGCTAAPAPEPDAGVARPPSTADHDPDVDADGPLPGGTLRIGLPADPISLDPRFVADDEGALVVGALFEPLVRLDEHDQVIPGAAHRWEIGDGGHELVFHLRRATFHDGTPVTAADFVRSFERIVDGRADPPSFLGYLLEPIVGAEHARLEGGRLEGVAALDDRTLVIRLVEPRPGFLVTLSDPSLVPVPPVADTDPDGFAAEPVGNGPFAMAGPREPEAFIRLTRFDEHHDPPLLDEVLLQVYPDDRARERAWEDLLEGALHLAPVAQDRREEALEVFGRSPDGRRGPGLLDGLTATVYLYGFDTTRPPLDDPRVRRAISLSIDRGALAREVMQDTRVPATGIVPPSLPGGQPGVCRYCYHDPAAARAMLEQVIAERVAGSEPVEVDEVEDAATRDGDGQQDDPGSDGSDPAEPDPNGPVGDEPADQEPDADRAGEEGLEDEVSVEEPPVLERLTLTYNRGRTHAAIAERMAADIEAALGIAVDFQAMDLHPFVRAARAGELAFFRLGWQATEPDPGAYLYPLFHSSQRGGDNLVGYADATIDELLDEARTAPDRTVALNRYRRAERLILDDAAVVPLLWYRNPWVVTGSVQDLVWSPVGRVDLARVWLDREA